MSSRAREAVRKWLGGARGLRQAAACVVDLVCPPSCVVCGDQQPAADPAGRFVCAACQARLIHPGPLCRRCGVPLASPSVRPDGVCARCRRRPLPLDEVVCLGPYQGLLRDVVLRAKRAGQDPLALALGAVLAARAAEQLSGWPPDWVIPIPVHWRRRLRRGRHCAELLAEATAAAAPAPFGRRALVLRRNPLKQGMLSGSQRRRNVRGAFAPNRGYALAGTRVLLVDDVMTSGATASEAAKTVRRAGAAYVAAAVVARGRVGAAAPPP